MFISLTLLNTQARKSKSNQRNQFQYVLLLIRAINKCLIFRFFLIAAATYTAKADGLWDSFADPSQEARTKLWWFHGETETTKEGIDADLRAFKDTGIGRVVFYDQTHGSQKGACRLFQFHSAYAPREQI